MSARMALHATDSELDRCIRLCGAGSDDSGAGGDRPGIV
jgi:hypothetical protein